MKELINKSVFTYLYLIIPVFVVCFLQSKELLDYSLNIRFLSINVFLLILSLIFVIKLKISDLFSDSIFIFYFIYILYSLISVFISRLFSDAVYQYIMIINFGILIWYYSIILKKYEFKIKYIALIFNIISFIILIITLYEYCNVLSNSGINHNSTYEIKASFSHKNILSEILFMFFPFSLFLLFVDNKWFKFFGLINAIGLLFFIIILLTRAVWFSVIIGMLLTVIVFLFISTKSNIVSVVKNKKTYFLILAFLSVIFSSLYVYSKIDSLETIKKSTLKIFYFYDSSQHRLELWKRSIDMTKESPFIGKGLGTWRIEVLKYGNRNLKSEDNITFYQRPHNDFLWLLSEQGVIGLILFLIVLFLVFKKLLFILKKQNSKEEYFFYYAVFYVLIGYLIISFFSFPKERIEHNFFIALFISFIITKYHNLRVKSKSLINNNIKFYFVFIPLIFYFIFSTYVAYSRYNSECHIKKAFEFRIVGNWNKVIDEINLSESSFYKIDPVSTPLRFYSGEANFNLNLIDKAFSDYQESYKINPYHIHVLNNLASCYEIKANHEMAIALYNKSLDISPLFEDALLNLTVVYFNIGNIDSAINKIGVIDNEVNTEKYKLYLNAVLKKKIDIILTKIDNVLIINLLKKIKSDNTWIENIFFKSKKNSINFDKQLLIDCVYILYNIDKTIDKTEFESLENEYVITK